MLSNLDPVHSYVKTLESLLEAKNQQLKKAKAEIRDRAIAETKLRNSQAKYRAIFEQAKVGIVRAGLDKKILQVNPQMCALVGYNAQYLQQQTFTDITHPEDRPSDEVDIERFLQGEIDTLVKEKRYCHSNGSIIWANVTVSLVNDAGNQPDYFIGVIEDISQKKQTQLALQESETRFQKMVDSFPFPVWISDETGSCYFFNQAWLNFTGRSLEQELGYGWLEGLHPQDYQRLFDNCKIVSEKQQSYSIEYRLQRSDGEYCWLLNEAKPRFKPDGSFAGFIGACIDISDRINAKIEREQLLQRIERENKFLESVLQQMPAGVVIASAPDGAIILTNQQVEPTLRHPLIPVDKIADYAQYGCLNADGKRRKAEEYSIVKALTQGKIIAGEESGYLCGDGSIRTLLVNAAPITNYQSKTVAAVATFYDITEIKQAREIKKDAENKALMLKEIHHRIKNNLQIISALLDLQSLQTKATETKKVLEESQTRIQTMALIHESLYTSESFDRINLSDYIQSLTTYLQKTFIPNDKQIRVTAKLESIYLDVDRAIHCGLIINELVTNALKYGFKSKDCGEINICLSRLNCNWLRLTIRDNGIGMAKNIDLENIQTLGLSLVDSLVETQLEGRWKVDRLNGTIFDIEFPIE